MATFISQESLLQKMREDPTGFFNEYSVVSTGGDIGTRITYVIETGRVVSDWTYGMDEYYLNPDHLDPRTWIFFTLADNYGTNSIDDFFDLNSGSSYTGYKGGSVVRLFTVHTWIQDNTSGGDPAQVAYRNKSKLQATSKSKTVEGSTQAVDYSCNDITNVVNAPVFGNVTYGTNFATAAEAYSEDPTEENYEAVKELLKLSLNPPYSDEDDPTEDPEDGRSDDDDTKGGEGGKERDYDPVPIPPLPTITAAGAGFMTLYHLTQPEMAVFADDLYADNIWEAIKQFFSDPMDFIAGCHILPFTPGSSESWYPVFGNTTWPHSYQRVNPGMVDIPMGSIAINEYWGSAYDYAPYTKLLIWLPYCGYKDLNPDEVMGKTITVTYRVDIATGACVAFISIGVVGQTGPQVPRVIAQMTGNVATPVPVSSVSYDSAIRNAINLVATGASLAVGAAVAPAAAGVMAAGALASAATSTVTSGKPNVSRNGTIGASTGYMGVQTPYLLRIIPRLSLPTDYRSLKGYPSNMGGTLAAFTGYNEIADIKIEGINCTDAEYEEIERLVKEGIYV